MVALVAFLGGAGKLAIPSSNAYVTQCAVLALQDAVSSRTTEVLSAVVYFGYPAVSEGCFD